MCSFLRFRCGLDQYDNLYAFPIEIGLVGSGSNAQSSLFHFDLGYAFVYYTEIDFYDNFSGRGGIQMTGGWEKYLFPIGNSILGFNTSIKLQSFALRVDNEPFERNNILTLNLGCVLFLP